MNKLTIRTDRTQEISTETSITFRTGALENAVEIMRLDKDGMIYKGVRIEDAGEAHRAFIEAMKTIAR